MKKIAAFLLVLSLLLLCPGAFADDAIDTSQLQSPFDIGLDDFILASSALMLTDSSTQRDEWQPETEIGDGFVARSYTADNSLDVKVIGKDGLVYATMLSLEFDVSRGADGAYDKGNMFGRELAMIVMSMHANSDMQMSDFTQAIQVSWLKCFSDALSNFGQTTSEPMLEGVLSTFVDVDALSEQLSFKVVYSKGAYTF